MLTDFYSFIAFHKEYRGKKVDFFLSSNIDIDNMPKVVKITPANISRP